MHRGTPKYRLHDRVNYLGSLYEVMNVLWLTAEALGDGVYADDGYAYDLGLKTGTGAPRIVVHEYRLDRCAVAA